MVMLGSGFPILTVLTSVFDSLNVLYNESTSASEELLCSVPS